LYFFQKNGNMTVYTGYEQTNTTGARNASWAYGNKNGTTTPAAYLPWGANQPNTTSATSAVYYPSGNAIKNVIGTSNSYNFVCEYGRNYESAL
jgi:hypothetical protein